MDLESWVSGMDSPNSVATQATNFREVPRTETSGRYGKEYRELCMDDQTLTVFVIEYLLL